MKLFFVFLSVVLLTACSPSLKFQESYVSKDLKFNEVKSGSITVYGASNIILNEFIQTFKDEYSDTIKLNNKIVTDFKTQFSKQIPTAKIISGKGTIPSAMIGEFSFKDNNHSVVDSFFNSLVSDYLIFINTLQIGNEWEYNTTYNPTTNMSSGYSSEKCKVETEIECWQVKDQKRLYKIKSYGSDTVILFTFLSSLNSAISEAIENGVKYIADDGKK